jgi:hypothetical protein
MPTVDTKAIPREGEEKDIEGRKEGEAGMEWIFTESERR